MLISYLKHMIQCHLCLILTSINSEGQKVSKFYQEINGKLMDHSGARPRKALEESGMEEQGGSGEF